MTHHGDVDIHVETVLLADEHAVLVPGVELWAHDVLLVLSVVVAVPARLHHGVLEAQHSNGGLGVWDAGESDDSTSIIGGHVLAQEATSVVQLDSHVVILEGSGSHHQANGQEQQSHGESVEQLTMATGKLMLVHRHGASFIPREKASEFVSAMGLSARSPYAR